MERAFAMYSDGIRKIVEEHAPLRAQMKEIIALVRQLDEEPRLVTQLNSVVTAFIVQVEPHSRAEDEVLSPLLAKHLGNDAPPVVGNAAQHEEARRLLRLYQISFQTYTAGDRSYLKQIKESLESAVNVLTAHFDFEEDKLFPLAEKTLTDEEKAELYKHLEARG